MFIKHNSSDFRKVFSNNPKGVGFYVIYGKIICSLRYIYCPLEGFRFCSLPTSFSHKSVIFSVKTINEKSRVVKFVVRFEIPFEGSDRILENGLRHSKIGNFYKILQTLLMYFFFVSDHRCFSVMVQEQLTRRSKPKDKDSKDYY